MIFSIAVNPTCSEINFDAINLFAIDSAANSVSGFEEEVGELVMMEGKSGSDSTGASTNDENFPLILIHNIFCKY